MIGGENDHKDMMARMDQILRVDTGSLLSTLKDLEYKLSEHHRQDKFPPWATSFLLRLEQLEF